MFRHLVLGSALLLAIPSLTLAQSFQLGPFPTPVPEEENLTVEMMPPLSLGDWEATAGSTVPVKFRIVDEFGNFVETDEVKVRIERTDSFGSIIEDVRFCRPAKGFCDGDVRLEYDDFGQPYYLAVWHTDRVQGGAHQIRIALVEEDLELDRKNRIAIKTFDVEKDSNGKAKGRAKNQ